MPKSKSSRSGRDQDKDQDYRSERRRGEKKDGQKNNRDRGDQRRDLKDKSDKNDTDRAKDRGLSRSASGVDEGVESSRGPADFPNQVGSAGFSQFPGQYDGGIPGAVPGVLPRPSNGTVHPAMSSHVQDQFPGQFPVESAAPYRPPIAASEGGPGLAAEYYGDAGESVAEQPGFRKHSPSLIIGAEPHLLPASAVANPPPEPSASGGVGAAASFFNGSFDESEAESTHAQPASSTYGTAPSRPDNSHHSASAPVIPTIGGAAMGAAAGYVIGGHTSSHQPRPHQAQSGGGAQSEYPGSTFEQSSSQVENAYYSEETRPSKPGKSSHPSNIPMYAAGAAGAAGLAAAAYHQAHQSSSQHNSSNSQYPTTPMAQRHRHHGPLDAVVDFFRDPDGVAQFEEYSEIIGVCKYCFAPGSSPRDAPRKHYYRRRRSNERLGSSMRVDKDSRYYSSENERQRRKEKSWLASGLAGYGLGKMGETLFKQENDFDDTYSVKTGRQSPEGRSHKPRRRSRSKESVEIGITSDDRIRRKDPPGGVFSSPTTVTYTDRRHSRPKSPERKSSRTEAALGAAIGASMAGSTSRRRSHSPKGAWVKNVRKTREHSPERRRKSHKKKKERGFFGFINGSSSSSSLDLTYSGDQEKRPKRKNTTSKPNDDKKAEAALLGLGAAAAALALNDSRQGHKKKGVKELVGVKESRDKNDYGLRHDRRHRASSVPEEDEVWESAPEDDQESIDSDLAYGAHGRARRGSRESLSSESSGTDKWGWRWGSKKKHRDSPPSQKLSDHSTIPAMSGVAAAGLAGASMMSPDPLVASAMDSTSSLPLQKVYPVATSDPSCFDIGREGPLGSFSRPGVVPIQHPQPVTPVSSAIYSSQAPYEHSYSAPTGAPVFSQLPSQQRSPAVPVRSNQPDFSIPGGYPQASSQAKDDTEDFKLRRRGTSPARFNAESVENGMTPARRPSAKDDISAVRFDLTEEQEDRDRSERRRRRKEDRQRRAAEEQEQIDKERRAAMDISKVIDAKTDDQERPEQSSAKSWAVPAAAAGVVGAAIGAAVVEVSKSDETREERKARRRRERELEEAADEEADRRRRHERRRRERELERQQSASKESQRKPDDLNEVHQDVDREQRSTKEESVPQRAASPRRSSTHEDYGAFFVPTELLERSNDKVKITSAGADADVDPERSSRVVTTPKGEREPVFSPADTDDKIDASRLSFPWFVPRLRLVEPTPPSSRGATPILRPKDASDDDIEESPSIEELRDVEEPAKPVSTPRVTWGDTQRVEYTVITPHDEREEFIQSAPEQRRETDQSSARDETVSPHTRQSPPNGAATGKTSSFGNDIEFAATLAATAEDAGFDPSIVINDPKYRRRESPPGSNERSMPGEFRDDDEVPLSGKESKKRTRANGRDDDAVVQDILNQVEYIEPEASLSDPVEEVEDRETSRKSRSKMTKKSRENRGSRDESYEDPQLTGRSRASSSRDLYESPTEDAQSTVSSGSGNKNVENSKKSRSRSIQNSTGFDDAASTRESSNDAASKSKEKSKRNLWSRVLGKPADSPLQENGSKDVKSEALAEEIDETKSKSQRSKKRRSTRDEADDDDVTSKSSGMSERSRRRQSSETSTARESGRITQDVPAKVYTPAPYGHTVREGMLTGSKERDSSRSRPIPDAGSVAQYLDLDDQPEQDNAQMSESFLGMRPQPPPTPSIPNKEKEPPDPTVIDLAASPPSLPDDHAQRVPVPVPPSPPSLPDDHTQRVSVPIPPSPLQYPAALPSPTAVPITFRRPGLSGARRSRSQTPLSSTQSAPDISPRSKPRPRSTEFRGSKDMRPLWLVERHNSHQEQGDEETYPPLPSSHSTSRASSVHDSEEHNRFQISDHEIGEGGHEAPVEAEGLMIETQDKAKELDLLDSQQATPTAAFFEHPLVERRSPSPARELSHGPPMQEKRRQSSPILEDAALGAVFAGSAAYALHGASHHEDLSRQRLSEEENEQLQQDLDDKVPASDPRRSYEDESHSIQEVLQSKGEQSQQDSSGVSGFDDTVPQEHHEDPLPQDFAHQRSPDVTKIKLEGSENLDPIIGMAVVPHVESTELESLNHEDGQQILEQASPDAVTSSKKDQKNEDRAFVEKEQRASELGEARGLLEDHVEPMEILNSRKEEVLTKEMPRNQVIGIMTTIAQDENLDIPQTQNGLEERQTKSESNDDEKWERNTMLTHDLPSSAKTMGFIDPFVDRKSENVPQNPQVEVAAEEVQRPTTEKELVPNPPVFDVSPEGTPLPLDDDLDLLDALPPSPISQEKNQEFEPQADNAEFFNKLSPREELRFSEQYPSSRNDVQNLEGTADGALDSLSQNDKAFNPEPSTITKMQEDGVFPSAVPTGNADSTGQIGNLEGNKLVGPSVEELSAAEDQWPSVSGEKKDKQSQKSEQTFGDDSKSANEAEAEEKTELPATVTAELEDDQFNNPDSNTVADVPPVGSRGVEDDWASFSRKKQGKKGRKKKSEAIDLEPGAFEKDQVEPQASTQELTNESVPAATTTTAQEVSEMLDKAEDIDSVQPGTDKLFTNEAMQAVQKSEAGSPSHDNLALAEEKTATQQAHRLETHEAMNTTQSKAEKEAPPVVESSVATIGTAKVVQDVLEEEKTSLSRPAPQDEAEVIPVAIEDPSPSETQIKEVDELERDVLKDEKGSRADPTQLTTPPVEVEPPLVLEPKTGIAENSSGKKSRKDKKNKKQSRSVPARNRQDDISPDFTTIDSSQEIEQDTKLSNASFPTSARDILLESVVEPTGPRESTPSADSKDISDVELPKKQDIPQTWTRKEKRKSKKNKAFIGDEDATRDPGYDRATGAETPSGNAPTTTSDIVGGKSLETLGPTEFAPSDGQRDISEVVLSQEPQIPAVPKNKKGKKKSKKDKAFSWNEDSAPTPGDEPTVEASEFNEDVLENTADTKYGERPASTGAAEPTPSTGSKEISEAELPRGSDMALPQNKKDKKKSKKSKRFSWEDDESPTPVDDAGAKDQDPVEQIPEYSTHPGDAIIAESEYPSESRPKSKKDRKKAKKAQALSWEGEENPSLTKETIQDPVETVDQAPAAESNRDEPITVHRSSPIESKSESPYQQPIQNMSMDAPLEEAQREHPAPAPTEQNSIASLDSGVRQMGDLEDHVGDAQPSSSMKQGSEEDKQEGKEARAPSLSAELRPHSEETSEESAPKGNSDAPTIIQLPEDPQMWSKQEQLTEHIEPTEVVAPNEKPESRDFKGESRKGDLLAQTSDVGALEGAGDLEELPVGERSVETDEDRPLPKAAESPHLSTLETEQDDGTSLEGQPQEAMRAFEEIKATQSTGVATRPALEQENPSYIPAIGGLVNAVVEDEPWDTSAVKEEKGKGKSQSTGPLISQNESENVEAASLATRDLSVASKEDSPQRISITNVESTPSTSLANSEVAVETSVRQKSPHNPEEYHEAASQVAEPSHSQEEAVPNPVEEVEKLYAEDEFNHGNERPSIHGMQGIVLPHSATEGPPTPAAEAGMMYAHGDRDFDNEHSHEEAMQRQQAPPSELELSTADRKTPDLQEVREHNDRDTKQRELHEIEHPLSQPNDPLTPTTEDQMQEREWQVKLLSQASTDGLSTHLPESKITSTTELPRSEEYLMNEHEKEDTVRPQSPESDLPTTDLPTPIAEVRMLDPQEQRRYEEAYARELQRQLSPAQNERLPDVPSDEVSATLMPASSVGMIIEAPYDDIHRPLAQAPGLEDIIEEPGSRSVSVQGNPAPPAQDDQFPFKPTKSKKGNKGKKGKKQKETIIWEDETATPPIEDETDQLVEPPTRSGNTPSSFENEELQQPIDLEEPIARRPVEQLVEADFKSPTRDLSSYRDSPKEHGEAGDYFSIQSTKGAEKDVGMDTTVVREDPSSAELSRAVKEEPSVEEPSVVHSDERYPREYRRHNEDDTSDLEHAAFDRSSKAESTSGDARAEVNPSTSYSRRSSNNSMRSKRSLGLLTPELEHAALDERSRAESTSADARVNVNPSVAHSRSSNNSLRSKRSLGLLTTDDEPEPSTSNRPLDEQMIQPIRPDVSSLNSFSEMRTSKESSLHRHPEYVAEPVATDNRSQTKSTLEEGLATAAGLGIGAVAAGGLSRIVSKEGVERDKSRSRWEDLREGTRDSESPISRADSVMESRESGKTIERQTSTIAQQESLRTPSASPPPPTRYVPITREPDSREAAQTIDTFNVRDSGYVADSPIVSDEVPVHRSIRDSGYPETEASPTIGVESHIQESLSPEEIQEGYGSLPAHLPVQYDHEYQNEEPRGSLPETLPTLPVEASPVPDALTSKPKERRRRRRSGASYDSDDSNDSGFDIQRRRRKQAMMDDVREPSPVSSTTKERSSELFGSSPSARQERVEQRAEYDHTSSHSEQVREEPTWSFGREVSPSTQGRSRDASGETESTNPLDKAIDSPAYHKLTGSLEESTRSLFGGPISHDEDAMSRSMSPLSTDGRGHGRLNTIAEETSPLPKDRRAMSDVGSSDAGVQEGRMRSPPVDDDTRSYISTEDRLSRQLGSARDEHSVDLERSRSRHTDLSSRHSTVSHASILPHKHADGEELNSSIASISSDKSIHAIIRTPDQVRSASGQSFRSSATPPLRRVDRSVSGDLRGASKRSEAKTRAKTSEEDAELDINIPSSSTYDPVTDKGKNRADMADVYVSPLPRQPDDESLDEANLPKQEGWGDVRAGSPMSPTRPPSMRKRQSMQLLEYETRLDQLVSENRLLQTQKTTAERTLEDQARDHSQQRHAYEEALQEHKMFLAQKDSELNELKGILEEWQSKVDHLTEVNETLNSRGLDEEHEERYRQLETEHTNLREQHTQLSTGMEEIVRHEVSVALEEKNLELRQLRDELENAKQQVRNLQQQLLVSRSNEDFIERDEDYFDGQCQSLCQHVQQWVLRFSKFSDMKACYHPSEIRDEKIVDRVENAILDGTDVDEYLQDRVKRRDVFMSVVMTMIWEFIFTRYLFGMDREQRQKLKNLEKTLQEVGPISAVHKWRATTLTLLMKRPSFESQRATDTEAVVQEIYDTLATFLPPPSHLVNQIQESLRKVINAAVDLSIEMRTQRAEYSMLPPLQPEYDTNGDLARKVYFSALTMNERSGQTSSNDALQEQRAVVRMVLFPLVVKNEDDDEQIVVCPAQVLVADGTKGKGKSVRVMSAARSEASFAGTDAPREGGMI